MTENKKNPLFLTLLLKAAVKKNTRIKSPTFIKIKIDNELNEISLTAADQYGDSDTIKKALSSSEFNDILKKKFDGAIGGDLTWSKNEGFKGNVIYNGVEEKIEF